MVRTYIEFRETAEAIFMVMQCTYHVHACMFAHFVYTMVPCTLCESARSQVCMYGSCCELTNTMMNMNNWCMHYVCIQHIMTIIHTYLVY